MHMKEIKLQIGDYVFIKSSSGDTTLIKIAAVHQKKVGYHNVPNKLNWVRFSLLEPIPLTIEILKKNGFITRPGHLDPNNPHHWEFSQYEEETGALLYCIKAYCCNPFRGLYISIENHADCEPVNFNKQIEHFHEFQQALRLCGLDELADNLKIEK